MSGSLRAITLGLVVVLAWSVAPSCADAEPVRVAVASNFAAAMQEIARHFTHRTRYKVVLSFGSTGKHYAQIRHGAPFQAFFAADVERPRLLEAQGIAQPSSRFTYAMGKLVLWSPQAGLVDRHGKVLEDGGFHHLAIANPKLAPYGEAAREVLVNLGLWRSLQSRLVRGENIAQTFQYVHTGNAELGFVAWSQIQRPGKQIAGSWWEIDTTLYTPIQQQAVLLQPDRRAQEFLAFIASEPIRELIRAYGYDTPRR